MTAEKTGRSGTREGVSSEERELKISLSEEVFESLQERISQLGLSSTTAHLTDVYYDDSNFLLTNLNRGMRVRSASASPTVLEFKSLFYIPDLRPENPWLVEEVQFEMPIQDDDVDAVSRILKRLGRPMASDLKNISAELLLKAAGFYPRITVDKDRVEYQHPEYLWVFDKVEGLGNFVEVEAGPEIDPQRVLDSFLNKSDYVIVREGYNDMIARNEPGVVPSSIRQGKFFQDSGWNLLPGEYQIIHALLQI